MSYAIMSQRGGETHLVTYRTVRPANIVYFDGMSASWGPGWLDSQEMFIYGVNPAQGKNSKWWDDYGRADKLCSWAEPRDIDGIVRMNAGFEIIWCDFNSSKLQLVSHLNITPPGTPLTQRTWFPRFPDDLPSTPGYPPQRRPPRRPRISQLAETGQIEWVRAASHRAFSPQPHLTLLPSGMVSYYHPRLTSLVEDRINRSMNAHRLANISSSDAVDVVHEINAVLARFKAGVMGSGMNWIGTSLDIIEQWGDRISHMHALLLNMSDPSTDATASLPTIRALSYTPLNPYMQPGLTPNASAWDLFFGMSPNVPHGNVTAFERCTTQTTGFLTASQRTSQEDLLQESIETVLSRLCSDVGTIFVESSDLVQGTSKSTLAISVHHWRVRIEKLMKWLDWSVWLRCDQHVCSTPLWPIAWVFRRPGEPNRDEEEELKPRCIRMAV
ncbi:hypothetical protein MIND_01066600 [Mycena indigotica]|uniref:Uncharacterized protein n=1 Tax=Mycena indigotica TaxID=2126181 RepID=A0A8H6SAP0_9AGAR|nr:uncharacterized protein MIND_01066600 [Mycena indigotica]KAF7295275.1 hypothetical protein MIND_01066600 [Mycena indigotica]